MLFDIDFYPLTANKKVDNQKNIYSQKRSKQPFKHRLLKVLC